MRKNVFLMLVVGIVILLMITSCSNEIKSEPTPTTEPTPTVTETEQKPAKSDTQQIIDNVLAFVEAESEGNGQGDYWYNGINGYRRYKWEDVDSPNYQSDAYHITLLLKLNYDSEYPTNMGHDFPKIQEDLAMFDVSFIQDYGFAKAKSVFRFNLINKDGWKITNLRLIYTDWNDYKQYVS